MEKTARPQSELGTPDTLILTVKLSLCGTEDLHSKFFLPPNKSSILEAGMATGIKMTTSRKWWKHLFLEGDVRAFDGKACHLVIFPNYLGNGNSEGREATLSSREEHVTVLM